MKFNLPDIIEKDCRDKEDYQQTKIPKLIY